MYAFVRTGGVFIGGRPGQARALKRSVTDLENPIKSGGPKAAAHPPSFPPPGIIEEDK